MEFCSHEIGRPAFCFDDLCIFMMSLKCGSLVFFVRIFRSFEYCCNLAIVFEIGVGSWVNSPFCFGFQP